MCLLPLSSSSDTGKSGRSYLLGYYINKIKGKVQHSVHFPSVLAINESVC